MKIRIMRVFVSLAVVCATLMAQAGAVENVIIDEYGNGTWVDSENVIRPFIGVFGDDPSGGTLSALVYLTPFTFSVEGDYEIYEPDTHELVGLVRFYGNNTIIFYDNDVGFGSSPADGSGIPAGRMDFVLGLNQTLAGDPAATEVNPTAGMAGFEGIDRLYTFLSVYPIPEPGGMAMIACGTAIMLLRRRKNAWR